MWLCFSHHWLLCDYSIGMCQQWPHCLTPLFQALPDHPQPADQGTRFSSLLHGSKVRGPILGSCCVSCPALEPLIQACTHFQLLSLSPFLQDEALHLWLVLQPSVSPGGALLAGWAHHTAGHSPTHRCEAARAAGPVPVSVSPSCHPKPSFGFQYLFSMVIL